MPSSVALGRRAAHLEDPAEVLVESARTTAMLFTLLIAATIFANFVNFTSMPVQLKDTITTWACRPSWSSPP